MDDAETTFTLKTGTSALVTEQFLFINVYVYVYMYICI